MTTLMASPRLGRAFAVLSAGVLLFALLPPAGAQASHGDARGTANVCPAPGQSGDAFSDDNGSIHEDNINCAAGYDLIVGTGGDDYSPGNPITRAQMGTFIATMVETALGESLPAGGDVFADDQGNVHETNINKVANAGIVQGTGGNNYSPGENVSRAQMATFIANAIDYADDEDVNGSEPPAGEDNHFNDDDGNIHEDNIDALHEQLIVVGTGGSSYSPNDDVTRAQMATFVMQGADYLGEIGQWAGENPGAGNGNGDGNGNGNGATPDGDGPVAQTAAFADNGGNPDDFDEPGDLIGIEYDEALAAPFAGDTITIDGTTDLTCGTDVICVRSDGSDDDAPNDTLVVANQTDDADIADIANSSVTASSGITDAGDDMAATGYPVEIGGGGGLGDLPLFDLLDQFGLGDLAPEQIINLFETFPLTDLTPTQITDLLGDIGFGDLPPESIDDILSLVPLEDLLPAQITDLLNEIGLGDLSPQNILDILEVLPLDTLPTGTVEEIVSNLPLDEFSDTALETLDDILTDAGFGGLLNDILDDLGLGGLLPGLSI